jgi:hypothetical protein
MTVFQSASDALPNNKKDGLVTTSLALFFIEYPAEKNAIYNALLTKEYIYTFFCDCEADLFFHYLTTTKSQTREISSFLTVFLVHYE